MDGQPERRSGSIVVRLREKGPNAKYAENLGHVVHQEDPLLNTDQASGTATFPIPSTFTKRILILPTTLNARACQEASPIPEPSCK